MRKSKPLFFFSFRSPYSWLAFKKLDENHHSVLEEVELIPFWEPDETTLNFLKSQGGEFLYSPMSKEKHLYILYDIKRMAKDFGIKMKWPIDDKPRWELSHLCYLKAEEKGKGLEFIREVYKMRWEKGLDISKEENIKEILSKISLDSSLLDQSQEDSYKKHGSLILKNSYNYNIFGVPFFINGKERFWGIDRLNLFIESFESKELKKVNNTSMELIYSNYETDIPGGCG